MADGGIDEARSYLSSIFPSAQGACFECTPKEGEKAFLLRFAAAGAAIRYRTIHRREVSDIVALDVALRRNERSWFEHLPDSITAKLIHKLYYGHFFCHVFHQDYVVKKGFDPMEVEHEMWRILDQRHANQILFGSLDALLDRQRNFARFAGAETNVTAFIAHDDQRGERKVLTAFDDLGYAVDRNNLILQI